jgi:CheY-like chemotaxis protein
MRPLILVVDDEEDTRDVLMQIVEKEGYDSSCAHNGAAAIKELEEARKHPDLILLDIMMPGVTAKEVVELISTTERYSKIKIIYVSAVNVTETEEKELLKPKQVVGLIPKPFDLPDLVKAIKNAIG